MTNKYSFLLLSGGVGSRSDLNYPKQFYMLNGHPMVAYSLIAAIQVEQCWFPRGIEPVFPPRSEPPLSMVF